MQRQFPPFDSNPDVPSRLEEIINKALEKDRNFRYQGAAEMKAGLQRLKRDTDSGRAAVAAPQPGWRTSGESTRSRAAEDTRQESFEKSRTSRIWPFLGVVALLAGVGWFTYKLRQAPTPSAHRALTRLTFDEGLQIEATWSPDGKPVSSL